MGLATLVLVAEELWRVVVTGTPRLIHVRLLLLLPGGLHLTLIRLIVVHDHLEHLELILL